MSTESTESADAGSTGEPDVEEQPSPTAGAEDPAPAGPPPTPLVEDEVREVVADTAPEENVEPSSAAPHEDSTGDGQAVPLTLEQRVLVLEERFATFVDLVVDHSPDTIAAAFAVGAITEEQRDSLSK